MQCDAAAAKSSRNSTGTARVDERFGIRQVQVSFLEVAICNLKGFVVFSLRSQFVISNTVPLMSKLKVSFEGRAAGARARTLAPTFLAGSVERGRVARDHTGTSRETLIKLSAFHKRSS